MAYVNLRLNLLLSVQMRALLMVIDVEAKNDYICAGLKNESTMFCA